MPYSEQRAFLPRRCKGMPEVYLVEDHPLLDGVDHVGKVYVGRMNKVGDLIPLINERMRWTPGTPLKLYEVSNLSHHGRVGLTGVI